MITDSKNDSFEASTKRGLIYFVAQKSLYNFAV